MTPAASAGADGRSPAEGGVDPKTALGLLSAAASLNSAVDLDFLLQRIGAAAEGLLDSEASAVLLLTPDKKRLYFKIASGEKGKTLTTMSLAVGEGIAGWVAQNRKPEVVNDAQKDPHFASQFDKVSGFATRSALCVPMVHLGGLVGVVEVLNRRAGAYGEEHVCLLQTLASFAAAAVVQSRTILEQKNFFSHVLELLTLAIEASRPNMEGHAMRSSRLAVALGRALGVDDYEYRMLNYAGLLHDIGYVAMQSPEVLADMGITDAAEEVHPVLSAKLLEGITMFEGALPMILHHHERYDGLGYPDKLAGEAIPLGARILALVECVEELRMVGGLRGRTLHDKAAQEARDGAGKAFDPKVVEAFASMVDARTTSW